MLEQLNRLVRQADRRLRTVRAVRDASRVALWTAVALALIVLVVELSVGFGFNGLWLFLAVLVAPTIAAVLALSRAPGSVRSAKALDQGSRLHDRIGTAIAFEGTTGGMLQLQRQDALAQAQGLRTAAAIPLGAVVLRRPAVALLLLLLLTALCLRFDLRGSSTPPPTPLEEAGEDLLASLEDIEEDALARGDKRVEYLVTDLNKKVRKILDDEKDRKQDEPEPEPEKDEPEEEDALAELPAPMDDLYSVAELDALHSELQVELAAVTDFNLENVRRDARNFFKTDTSAKAFEDEFDNLNLAELDIFEQAEMGDNGFDPAFGKNHNPLQAQDNARSMASTDAMREEAINFNKNDISDEGMIDDDKKHGLQESFNEFLEQYVAERGEQMADWLAGKREHQPEVKVKDEGGPRADDKTDAMAEAGFEDVTEEETSASGEAMQSVDSVPDGMDVEMMDKATRDKLSGGIPMGEGEGETTRGAQGAGKGGGEGPEASESRQLPTGTSSQELEKILGQVTDDRLPPEKRREVLEEIATHKVHGGFANDFEDTRGNYFEEADRLLFEEADELPPLFRNFAHEYFEAILNL